MNTKGLITKLRNVISTGTGLALTSVVTPELPQTGEAAANAGLVAGGILSMLSAAFVFFRKGK